jgi:hypothetical protein
MSKPFRFSVVLSFAWMLISIIILFNLIYIDRPDLGSDFWLVFLRSVALISILPLSLLWGAWWILRAK